jgi:hypothetical protein
MEVVVNPESGDLPQDFQSQTRQFIIDTGKFTGLTANQRTVNFGSEQLETSTLIFITQIVDKLLGASQMELPRFGGQVAAR